MLQTYKHSVIQHTHTQQRQITVFILIDNRAQLVYIGATQVVIDIRSFSKLRYSGVPVSSLFAHCKIHPKMYDCNAEMRVASKYAMRSAIIQHTQCDVRCIVHWLV